MCASRGVAIIFFALVLAAFGGCSSESNDQAELIVYEAADDNGVNVFTIDPASGETRQLTSEDGFNGNPAWSPDRRRIIFVSDRDAGQRDIYVMDADGSNVVRLTDTAAREVAPKFSPDGKRIAFALDDGGEWSLRLVNEDGSADEEIAAPYLFVEFPSWRNDSEIFYSAITPSSTSADIFGIDLNTREISVRIATDSRDVCPHFSRDGKWLTYATDRGDAGEIDVYRHDLSSSDTTGASDVRLTDSPGIDDYANYSSDDSELVFVARRDGEQELYLMDADGGNQRRLTDTPGVGENVPDW